MASIFSAEWCAGGWLRASAHYEELPAHKCVVCFSYAVLPEFHFPRPILLYVQTVHAALWNLLKRLFGVRVRGTTQVVEHALVVEVVLVTKIGLRSQEGAVVALLTFV